VKPKQRWLHYNKNMNTLTKEIKNVIAQSEIVTIVTAGADGPHVVATWGGFVADLDAGDNKTLLIPAGGYKQTEKNLQVDGRVTLVVGSKQAPGKNGMGTGYRLSGTGRIETEDDLFDKVKTKFPWARGALVVTVEKAEQLL